MLICNVYVQYLIGKTISTINPDFVRIFGSPIPYIRIHTYKEKHPMF